VALAGATTPLERAQRSLDLIREQGRTALEAKTINEDEYRKRLTAATAAVNAAEAAEKALSKARSAASKEQRDAERQARQAIASSSDIQRRGAAGDQAMAQAEAEELQARRAVVHEVQERAALERQINAAQLKVKNEAIDKQIVDIKTDQNLAGESHKAQREQLIRQLQAVQWLNAWNASLNDQAVTAQAQEQLSKEALSRAQSGLENQLDILQAQAGLAKSTYARWKIELQIGQHQRELERIAADQVLKSQTANPTEKANAQARKDALDALDRLAEPKPVDDLLQSFSSAQDALNGLASAVKSHDWAGVWNSLAAAIETLKTAFASGGTIQGKIGAVAGVANAAGNAIGGGFGSALAGAAGGALAGAQIGSVIPGIGTAIGARSAALLAASAASSATPPRSARKSRQASRPRPSASSRSPTSTAPWRSAAAGGGNSLGRAERPAQ
jgi:chemotaxis protein histidine kinase CheA